MSHQILQKPKMIQFSSVSTIVSVITNNPYTGVYVVVVVVVVGQHPTAVKVFINTGTMG